MAKKTPKTALGRWRVRINQLRAFYEQRLQAAPQQHDSYRQHAEQLMTMYVGKCRRYEEALANNNVTITELQQQLAVQAKMLAEAQTDGAEAIARYNKYVGWCKDLRHERDDLRDDMLRLRAALDAAKLRPWHRARSWIKRQIDVLLFT